ncbi:MAG: glycosyltransferase, partial [Bifidobacteriaceae bacterium]|nr:glycosyltransferase [Bifidobacteriaceae bacterium]
MVKVLLILAAADGGLRAHVLQLATVLGQAGHQVVLAGPAETLLTAGITGDDATGLYTTHRLTALSLMQLRRIARQVGVVHAHGLKAGALAVLLTRSTRVVVTLHNRPVGGKPVRLIGWLLAKIAIHADSLLVVSTDLGDWLKQIGARSVERALIPAPPTKTTTADTAQ